MPFLDRADAGRKLATALAGYRDRDPVVLALPRGGVPVAAEIAAALAAPLDLVLVRKIGVPFEPELAMGAVVDGDAPLIVRNEDVIRLAHIDEVTFESVAEAEVGELERRRNYLGGRPHTTVVGQTAIVVDDGVATGATTRAALRATRMRSPKWLVLAIPVAPTESLDALRSDADDVVCLEDHAFFAAISAYYRDFGQVSDETVSDILRRFPPSRRAGQ